MDGWKEEDAYAFNYSTEFRYFMRFVRASQQFNSMISVQYILLLNLIIRRYPPNSTKSVLNLVVTSIR